MSENIKETESKKCSIRFETIYHAQVDFAFNEDITFGRGKYNNKDEYYKAQDKMEAKINELCQKYKTVRNNKDYCTQGDGYGFIGENMEDLESFVKEFSSYIDRFSCIYKY